VAEYRIIDYHTKCELFGWRGLRYTDVDIARHWAIKKSEYVAIGFYEGDELLNLYEFGKPIKLSMNH